MKTEKEGDGVALYAMDHPLLITDEMLAAGASQITNATERAGLHEMLRAVYTAMCRAAPPCPEDISADAAQEVMLETCLDDATVEALAIRAALGNNGGEWATHYTDEQKEHWRRWVRDLSEAMTWQPIDTAPKPAAPSYDDRVYVDLWVRYEDEGFRVPGCYWEVTTEGTGFWEGLPLDCTPTHWMPVPDPPRETT